MPSDRISDKIDKKELSNIMDFLNRLKNDEKLVQGLLTSPTSTLKSAKIDLEKMGITGVQEESLVGDLVDLVSKYLDAKFIIETRKPVADVWVDTQTRTSQMYNFDRSTRSEKAFERATKSVRGAVESTKSSEMISSSTRFARKLDLKGFSLRVERIDDRPLISDESLEIIKSNFEKNLRQTR